MIKFFVPGRPKTKGSANWVAKGVGGKAVPIRDKAAKARESWMARVMLHASIAMDSTGLFVGPLKVTCMFFFERPKCHFGTGRNSHVLKVSAPQCPTSKTTCGDNDKLERAIFDAMSGIVYNDDSQIVENKSRKAYCTVDQGVWIYVEEVEP